MNLLILIRYILILVLKELRICSINFTHAFVLLQSKQFNPSTQYSWSLYMLAPSCITSATLVLMEQSCGATFSIAESHCGKDSSIWYSLS